MHGDVLFFSAGRVWKCCVIESQVSEILRQAHDKGGHFAVAMTMSRLKKISTNPHDWPLFVQEAAFELNRRVILHLGFTPYQIYFGF
jgi:hypothetical protein